MNPVDTYSNRFEFKYLIPLDVRDAIVREVRPFCRPDANTPKGCTGYRINSLYFDTPSLGSYRQKVAGERDRVKLRMRTYPSAGGDRCTLELKIKENNIVRKERTRTTVPTAMRLLEAGSLVDDSWRGDVAAEDHRTLEKILLLRRTRSLRPAVWVSYVRQAFLGATDARFRLTFDTDLRATPYIRGQGPARRGRRLLPFDTVVMEVKSNEVLPRWLLAVLVNHGCDMQKISKFCAGVEALSLLALSR